MAVRLVWRGWKLRLRRLDSDVRGGGGGLVMSQNAQYSLVHSIVRQFVPASALHKSFPGVPMDVRVPLEPRGVRARVLAVPRSQYC